MIPRPVRVPGLTMAVVALGACLVRAYPLAAQQPTPPSPSPALAAYRAPAIALVQPPGGGSVPQDKPVVVFRFAPGEPADPIDARSFAVAVDGADRTALFQLTANGTAGEAWGPLAAAADVSSGGLAPGAHQVVARVCSTRGACGSVAATVTVLPAPAAPAPVPAAVPTPQSAKRRRNLLGVLVTVGKFLLP